MRRWLFFLALFVTFPAMAADWERYAIVVGNNVGGPQRAKLWFAERDAERVASALVELGAFPRDRVSLLLGRSSKDFQAELGRIQNQISRAGQTHRSLLVLYYSGHADQAALELGNDRLTMAQLREWVAQSSAAVKVVLVDACQSGSLTQVKGMRPSPGLKFGLLEPQDSVRGVAYVASTAMGEAAQESAALQGSFFSHHLEVALRGAGDSDGDGVVTLNEAFGYTSARTVLGTAGTREGAQHPTYDVKMSGRGDVVLADLRRAEARLLLPADPAGRYWLRGARGLVAEIAGGAKPVTLGLPAGRYELQRREGTQRTGQEFDLIAGASFSPTAMGPLGTELATAKGGDRLEVAVGAGVLTGLLPGSGATLTARVGTSRTFGPWRARLRADGFNQWASDGGFRYRLTGVGTALAGFYGMRAGPVILEAGPELGMTWAQQSTGLGERWSAALFGAGVVGSATLRLGRWGMGAELGGNAWVRPISGVWRTAAGLSGALTVAYGF